ncbi:MAG: ROK family protein [Dehalococcoidia bacterium]|nr:ROK family protein [Dehalococcoidia bacterium]MDZ4247503.1 ROK family protein [Dehalococcoidia bacterium]
MSDGPGKIILGIDLGGTKILTALVNPEGEIIARDHSITPASQGQEAVIQSILDSTDRVIDEADIANADISAIGIGAPGLSDPQKGILYTSPNLPGWRDVPLRDIIEKELGAPTFLINDANAAAFGELKYGAGAGSRNFIYITVSTGIGGGIIIDGKIYSGSRGMAGELGHMTIKDDGPLCNCGNTGCWETLASGTALAREARTSIDGRAETSILKLAGGDIGKVNAEVIHRAALQGDSLAKELIARAGYYLGVGLANLINIFNPEKIVIGGGLSNIGDMLLRPAFEEAGKRAFKPAMDSLRFSRAELGKNSGVIGAAAFALQELNKPGS